MPIKLSWKAGNRSTSVLTIYRALGTASPEDTDLIATLPGDAVTYIDNTVETGKTYTYRIRVKAEYSTVNTVDFTQIDLRQRGPGSVTLVRGDSNYGYLGKVPASELPSVTTYFRPGADGSSLKMLNDWEARVIWHKFVRKGKIYIVPDAPMGDTVVNGSGPVASALNFAFTLGGASGIQWNFDTSDPKYDIYRKKNIVEANGWKYNLRLPRSKPDDWDGVNTSGTNRNDTEFADLIMPMYRGVPFMNNVGNLAPYRLENRGLVLCAETRADYNTIFLWADGLQGSNIMSTGRWVAAGLGQQAVNAVKYAGYSASPIVGLYNSADVPFFWPILELTEV